MSQSHRNTHSHTNSQASPLLLSLTQTLKRRRIRWPGESGEDGYWVLSGGGNLTGLPTRWKDSDHLLPTHLHPHPPFSCSSIAVSALLVISSLFWLNTMTRTHRDSRNSMHKNSQHVQRGSNEGVCVAHAGVTIKVKKLPRAHEIFFSFPGVITMSG